MRSPVNRGFWPYAVSMARPWKPLFFVPSAPVGPGMDIVEGIIETGRVVARSIEYRLVWDESADQWRMDMRAHAITGGVGGEA